LKALVVRFSSFGDIFHGLEGACRLKDSGFEVHWVTRSDYADLLETVPEIQQIWSLERKQGVFGLIQLALKLRSQKFTHIYDAHNNLRSSILSLIIKIPLLDRKIKFVRRSKERIKRLLLFKLGINKLPNPYFSSQSFIKPIETWIKNHKRNLQRQLNTEHVDLPAGVLNQLTQLNTIVIAPSAAWEMKRWPVDYWKQLITQCNENNFLILGGPEDDFCEEIARVAPERVTNLAGELSLLESSKVISKSKILISGDTGLMHLADFLNIPLISFIGPSAFGFPSNKNSKYIFKNLECQPCSKDGRGACHNKIYKNCLIQIKPTEVIEEIKKISNMGLL
jgi:ADP-heptose:LPS heptosyltransferase